MYDREMAQSALQMMSPADRAQAHKTARIRGMSACDVVLETALLVAQEESGKALYAMRQKGNRPTLQSV